jgi:hypothetical protein
MKKTLLLILAGIMMVSANAFGAGVGDLAVAGSVEVGTDTPGNVIGSGDAFVSDELYLDAGTSIYDTSDALVIGDTSTDFSRSIKFIGNAGECSMHFRSSSGYIQLEPNTCSFNVKGILFGGSVQNLVDSPVNKQIRLHGTDKVILSTGASGLVEIPSGYLDVNGPIYQRGGVLHADYVFEPDFNLESIEEHADFMWSNKHLQAMPKAVVDKDGREVVEVGAHRKGILEELEKAHIYIEQLNRQIKALEERIARMEAGN